MFDLFRSREKSVRLILGALLVMVAFSMLTYLVPNYGSGGGNDTVVAQVGNESVTQPDVQKMIQSVMRGRQISADILPNYIPTIIDNMISDRALAYQAAEMGYQISDEELRKGIQQMAPSLFQNGQFVGKDTYRGMLQQQGLTIDEFEADVRRQLLITRLRNIALEATVVTQAEIEQEYKKKNEKIKIEYVKLPTDKYKSEATPSLEDMQAYFKTNASRYMVPETKNLAILIADQSKIEASIAAPEDELQKIYSRDQNPYRIPESVKVRHILLKTEGKSPDEDTKIKAQADDLLKQVRSGANFRDLVKKYSEDTGSVEKGGEYELPKDGQMVPEFEKAAFSLKPGESAVIKTTYGYHILQVMSHDQPRLKPFAEVKAEIASNYKKQKVNDLMQQASDRAQAALQKDPAHPEKVAAEFDMQLVRAQNVEPGKPIDAVGPSPDFENSIASLKKGEVSQPVLLADNKIALAVVTDIVPPRASIFEEVKDKVRDALSQNRISSIVQKHATELLDKAKATGDLAKAAKSMGLEVKTSDAVARNGAIEGIGSAMYLADAFARKTGDLIGPFATPDGTVVARIVAHIDPDMSKLPEQRASIRDEIKRDRARDRNALFEAGVTDNLIKRGKIKKYPDAINRIIANYRSS
jgi:peptidyl-prolyl cis-trans isomerase D